MLQAIRIRLKKNILHTILAGNVTSGIRTRKFFPHPDAKMVDTTNMSKEQTLEACISWCEEKGIKPEDR